MKGIVSLLFILTAGVMMTLNAASTPEELQRQIDELKAIVKSQQEEIKALREKMDSCQNAEPCKKDEKATKKELPASPITWYGMVRIDAAFDSGLMNNGQVPFYALSPDDPNKRSNDNGMYSLTPRMTRIGVNINPTGQPFPDTKLTGKIEADFLSLAVSKESSAVLRVRHAYLQLQKKRNALLVGQTWDVISPLFPTANTIGVMWNAGNLGDRRPQIRYSYGLPNDTFNAALALGLTGSIDGLDLDSNGVRDGEDSNAPHLQSRIAWNGSNGSLGLWAHFGWLELTKPPFPNNKDNFTTNSIGADWNIKFAGSWEFRGEAWKGKNLKDFRGGIDQAVNTTTGKEIQSKGGWAEIGRQCGPLYKLGIGFSIDDPEDADLSTGGRAENSAWYLYNQFKFNKDLLLSLEYMYWRTNYLGMDDAYVNRFAAYIQQSF